MLKANINSKVNDFLSSLIYNTEKIRQSVEGHLIKSNNNLEKSIKKSA